MWRFAMLPIAAAMTYHKPHARMDDDIDLDEIQNILQQKDICYYGITGEDQTEWAEKLSCGVCN